MSSNSDTAPPAPLVPFILKITHDKIPLVEKMANVKFVQQCKVCDFCDMELPLSHPSKKCTFSINGVECPTIYDKCYKCSMIKYDQSKPHEHNICHQKHDINLEKNIQDQIQDAVSQITNRPKTVQVSIFGMSWSAMSRLRNNVEKGIEDDYENPYPGDLDGKDIDITQSLLNAKIDIPILNDLISRGASIHICTAGEGMLVKVLM